VSVLEERLKWLKEVISISQPVGLISYGYGMTPLEYNEQIFDEFLTMDGNKDFLLNFAKEAEKPVPIVLSNALGLCWVVCFEKAENVAFRYHIIGPVFAGDINTAYLALSLGKLGLSLQAKWRFTELLHSVPVIGLTKMIDYGLMLHYTLMEEKLLLSDVVMRLAEKNISTLPQSIPDSNANWILEQRLMKAVSEGNMGILSEISRISSGVNIGKLSLGDPIKHLQNAHVIFIALCSRAAINGGMSPNNAYSLSDMYIQSLETCSTATEISELSMRMVGDFVSRVHKIKTESGISAEIKQCIDYIGLHINEIIKVETLASIAGYAKNYLGMKFRSETGLTVADYVNKAKVEQAAILLKDSRRNVQSVCEELGFGSQSYFTKMFKRFLGTTPSEYVQKGGST
jgi:AraC-like DNA-binding protein